MSHASLTNPSWGAGVQNLFMGVQSTTLLDHLFPVSGMVIQPLAFRDRVHSGSVKLLNARVVGTCHFGCTSLRSACAMRCISSGAAMNALATASASALALVGAPT
jgi:hypothetical protein